MLKISLDTNAVLDLCYRTYPQHIFPNLWESLLAQKSANFIRFYICQSALDEVTQKITDYGYNTDTINNFLSSFNVEVITPDAHGDSTLELKRQLLGFPASMSSYHVTKDNYADLDIISLAHSWQGGVCVLTCEQKAPVINWDNKKHDRLLKVPNICEKLNITCGNWVFLFEEIGISI